QTHVYDVRAKRGQLPIESAPCRQVRALHQRPVARRGPGAFHIRFARHVDVARGAREQAHLVSSSAKTRAQVKCYNLGAALRRAIVVDKQDLHGPSAITWTRWTGADRRVDTEETSDNYAVGTSRAVGDRGDRGDCGAEGARGALVRTTA